MASKEFEKQGEKLKLISKSRCHCGLIKGKGLYR
jgi:hypothetical protein